MNKQYPPGYNFLQSIPRALKQVRNPIGTMEESMRIYNSTYSVRLGIKKFIVTQDPLLIEHVLKTNHRNYQKSEFQTDKLAKFLGKGLLTSNGDFWLKQRRLIQPGFHQEKIKALYTIIADTVDKHLSQIREGVQDIYPQMNALAFEIVINTLFNVHIPDETRKELSVFIFKAQEYVIKDIRQFYKSWWFKLSGEEAQNLRRSHRAREIVRNLINTRKASGTRRDDLLDMLLDARYEDTGEPMDTEQMIDEILVLIVAGHETTANALSWTLYLLAHHPEIQHQAAKDVDKLQLHEAVMNETLNNIIKESMRLYPPAWISDRLATNDDEFGDLLIPKGTIIVLFYYGLHRNEQHWKDATSFVPDRFNKTIFSKELAKSYHPFGSGPRLCIGNNFAMAEMTIFLHAFISRFTVSPTATHPRIQPLVTLKADQVLLDIRKKKI